MEVISILLGCVCVLVVTLYLQYRWKHRRVLEAASKLPCPPTLPLVGNALKVIFDRDVSTIYKDILRDTTKYGGLFCYWVGPEPIFVVTNATDAKLILQNTRIVKKNEMYHPLRKYLGQGLITAEEEIWKNYRPLINPIFRQPNLEPILELFKEVGEEITSDLCSTMGSENTNYCDIISNSIFRGILKLVYGDMCSNIESEKISSIMQLMRWGGEEVIIRGMNQMYSLDIIFNMFYWRKIKQASKCQAVFDALHNEILVDLKKNKGVTKQTDWTSMLDLWSENTSGTFEDLHWLDEFLTICMAGFDTTTTSVLFLLMSLATNQEAQNKVYEEIKEQLGERINDLTLGDLNSLTYLGYAITENMRLHSILGSLGRKTTKDINLSRGTIPAGANVLINFYAMGLNQKVFSEPFKFNPDRFASYSEGDRSSLESQIIPFGWGKRSCIGKNYAILEIKTIIVHILIKYKLSTHKKLEDLEYTHHMINYAKTPLPIDFQLR